MAEKAPFVRVIDNFHVGDRGEDVTVSGFATAEQALVYGLRRVRSSVEQFRKPGMDRDALYRAWLAMGEEVVVGGMYLGRANFDTFFAHPATAEERDYLSLAP